MQIQCHFAEIYYLFRAQILTSSFELCLANPNQSAWSTLYERRIIGGTFNLTDFGFGTLEHCRQGEKRRNASWIATLTGLPAQNPILFLALLAHDLEPGAIHVNVHFPLS